MSDSNFQHATQTELAQFLADNAANARRRLRPVGGGTAWLQSADAETVTIRLDQLNRVIDYPARDMTITVEAGIRMSELARILAAEGQRLPIDVPRAEQATLGGVIATNWSGSRRFGHGTMRDYVIGISAIDSSGREFKAGGRVVKNVAGYDICKLLVGSHGSLAIITQVTLKLRPIPETSALVRLTFDSSKQIEAVIVRLLNSTTRPMVMDVLAGQAGSLYYVPQLLVGYEGAERETNWQIETLRAETRPFEPQAFEPFVGAAVDPLWVELRDFVLATKTVTFKAALPASRTADFVELAIKSQMSAQAHAGNGIVIGHLPGNVTSVEQADALLQPLRELATSSGGQLTILNVPLDWKLLGAMSESLAGSLAWSQQLKRQLDPHNLLGPVPSPVA